MRNELEIIGRIESYLLQTMPATERAAFASELQSDPQLRTDLQHQQDIMHGMDRLQWKGEISKARFHYRLRRWLIALAVLAIVSVATGMILFSGRTQCPAEPTSDSISTTDSLESVESWGTSSEFLVDSLSMTDLILLDALPGKTIPALASSSQSVVEAVESESNATADRIISPSHSVEADRFIPTQVFMLDIQGPGVIETADGILIAYDRGCFVNGEGNVVNQGIQLNVREAIDVADMLKSGLSTTSGDDILQTAGMFSITACTGDDELQINPSKPLCVSTPSNGLRAGLRLWQGVADSSGKLDWQNPRELEQFLTPVDMKDLDFYPPGFLGEIPKHGFDAGNKVVTDSLYLSFEMRDQAQVAGHVLSVPTDAFVDDRRTRRGKTKSKPEMQRETSDADFSLSSSRMDTAVQQLHPSSVLAFWSDTFNKTNLATYEFQERMPFIHYSGDPKVLNCYLDNLDKPLHAADSLAAITVNCDSLRRVFMDFATRHDGRVQTDGGALAALVLEMKRKQQEFRVSAQAMTAPWKAKLEELYSLRTSLDEAELTRRRDQISEELSVTTQAIYKELGLVYTPQNAFASVSVAQSRIVNASQDKVRFARSPLIPRRNTFTVRNTGWHNIDCISSALITSRQTMKIRNGDKTSILEFDSCLVTVKDYTRFDEVFVYLVPKGMSSFVRLIAQGSGLYSECLNNKLSYDLVVIAYDKQGMYATRMHEIQPGTNVLQDPERCDNTCLKSILADEYTMINDDSETKMQYNFIEAQISGIRQNAIADSKMRSELYPVVFPVKCRSSTRIERSDIIRSWPQVNPVVPFR